MSLYFFLFAPQVLEAAPRTLKDLIGILINLIETAIPIVMLLALLVFMWGGARFILAAGSEQEVKKGKAMLLWGGIGLFCMTAVWGIVRIITDTFISI